MKNKLNQTRTEVLQQFEKAGLAAITNLTLNGHSPLLLGEDKAKTYFFKVLATMADDPKLETVSKDNLIQWAVGANGGAFNGHLDQWITLIKGIK
jgi:hypothetical protein